MGRHNHGSEVVRRPRPHWPALRGSQSAPGLGERRNSSIRAAAAHAGFVLDPWQDAAVRALDRLADNLASPRRHRAERRGLYLWGLLGRGKTWLVDAFFDAAPIEDKARVHFHSRFRDLQAAVRSHRSVTHAFDAAVGELLSGRELVCFDESHFVNLIHITHDRDMNLTLICDVPLDALLAGGLGVPDAELVASRLQLLTQEGPSI